ncbi:C-C motif chemokine 13-like [Salmo salar]|uniref:C-C motif chemokine 13-like n=1 Tax=Salmo salar TaxID=8030 RepID=A0ABM3E0N0_SALSA|nr:C-C motif chemokine 13-like [Salmo salar]|eukprot:XP_014032095.1 PREDICTED: C-C motif chemokine 13-like [Salmo salar]
MKTLTALLLLGLLCSLHTTSAGVISLDTAADCCMKFSTRIPLQQVVSLRPTSSSCPRKALIFTTKKGKTFCVDPSEAWVQSHVTKIESRSTAAKTTMMS